MEPAVTELVETTARLVCEPAARDFWRGRWCAWIRRSTRCLCVGGGMHKGLCFLGAV